MVFLGPSGVGKTHLATAIGVAADKKRVSTYFIKCHDLLQQLKKAKLENRLDARLRHFCHYKLLIIDEIGYLPIDAGGHVSHVSSNILRKINNRQNQSLFKKNRQNHFTTRTIICLYFFTLHTVDIFCFSPKYTFLTLQ